MQWHRLMVVGIALSLTACASRRGSNAPSQSFPAAQSPSPSSSPSGTIVTPARPKSGRVALVNTSARYVVVTFSLGHLPARESRLGVYRDGLKVAELKVTEHSRDINAVADIVAGECQVGDEVRDN